MHALELGKVIVIAAWHAPGAHDKLGEEGDVQTNEHQECTNAPLHFRVDFARELGPPIVEASHEGCHGSTHHHVMEMRHHEVGVVQVDIDAHGRKENAGKPANCEHPKEGERVEHGGVQVDLALVHGGNPIEHLDGGRDRDQESDGAEDCSRQHRLSAG